MLLGKAIENLRDPANVEEVLAAVGDWVLTTRLRNAAANAGQTMSDYAADAVAAFLGQANDEDWLALMTAANRADNPAAACLATMLNRVFAPPRCGHH